MLYGSEIYIVMEHNISILTTSKGESIVISASDFDNLSQYNWAVNGCGYVLRRATAQEILDGSTQFIYMHRAIMGFPDNLLVDHKNGIKTDNRRENLRLATFSENLMNSKIGKRNSSGFKGVHVTNNDKFKAYIGLNGKQRHLGIFDLIEDAVAAREKAEILYHGAFRLQR